MNDENPTPTRRLPAVAEFFGYFEAASRSGAHHERATFDADAAQATRLLSAVERASVRVLVGPPPAQHETFSDLHEAALRLSVLHARGLLDGLSGHAVAQNLHEVFFSAHPRALKYAAKGWHMLELLDRHDLAQVWIGTPNPADPRRLTRVRLSDRLAAIRNVA